MKMLLLFTWYGVAFVHIFLGFQTKTSHTNYENLITADQSAQVGQLQSFLKFLLASFKELPINTGLGLQEQPYKPFISFEYFLLFFHPVQEKSFNFKGNEEEAW